MNDRYTLTEVNWYSQSTRELRLVIEASHGGHSSRLLCYVLRLWSRIAYGDNNTSNTSNSSHLSSSSSGWGGDPIR